MPVQLSGRDIAYGLRALSSWEEYREFMSWERARFGMSPMNAEQFITIKREMGEPPRVNAREWDRFFEAKSV